MSRKHTKHRRRRHAPMVELPSLILVDSLDQVPAIWRNRPWHFCTRSRLWWAYLDPPVASSLST